MPALPFLLIQLLCPATKEPGLPSPSILRAALAQQSRTLEHGSSGPWEEMRPQKMNASGDLASFSSLYQPNSETSVGADLLEKNLAEIQNLRQRLEESISLNDRLRERLQHVLSNGDQGKDNQRVTSCQLESLVSLFLSFPLSPGYGIGEKKLSFCLVQSMNLLNPSRLHCSPVSPSLGTAQSTVAPHSYTQSHSSGCGEDIL
eukprot:XP_011508557.1 uncharacterized protein LOC101929805 isoform X3 [Homo sapiens]